MIINSHIPSPFAAEALACLQSAQMGLDLGIRSVVIEEKIRRGENTYLMVGVPLFAVAEVEKDKQWQESSD
ncbi:hypothetical protein PVK06_023972 [Gossypium arboreum]|uniref:Uncharacterized protein n=1 Tax=Gossypium arboreum TaxID=29729 RepID=A0ABR0PCR8_GOSAR|nr:hypothetical protein PVK06_023972 [Gossypium arboreum]